MSDVRQCDICGRTCWDKDDPRWGVLITTCLEWEEFDVCPACIGTLCSIPPAREERANKLQEQFSRREDRWQKG